MSVPLSICDLSWNVCLKLKRIGCDFASDLALLNVAKLDNFSNEEIEELKSFIEKSNLVKHSDACGNFEVSNVYDLLKNERTIATIPSNIIQLDKLLFGGIRLSEVTEICGVPGIGKTQLCLQLAVNVQLPNEFGGVSGKVLYLDTLGLGAYFKERILNLGKSQIKQYQLPQNITAESYLSNIYYQRCTTYSEIISAINLIPYFIKDNPQVKLVIIDSFAFHFRYFFGEDYRLRNKVLNNLGQTLLSIAQNYKVAVVITNQVTTRFTDHESYIIPALGDTWGHVCDTRLILCYKENRQIAILNKSPHGPKVYFEIEIDGFCGKPST